MLTPAKREQLRMMFGGKCAYCGCELTGKWHMDHVEAVCRDENGWKMRKPQNHRKGNFYPSCTACNILKASGSPEDLRVSLTYMAHSVPKIRTYSHVRHLMRFGKLTIDPEPVVFWFEKYRKENVTC